MSCKSQSVWYEAIFGLFISPKSGIWLCWWYSLIAAGALWSNLTFSFNQECKFSDAAPTIYTFWRTMPYKKPWALQTPTIFSIYLRILSWGMTTSSTMPALAMACSYLCCYWYQSSIFSLSWCSLIWSSSIMFSNSTTSLSLSLKRKFCNSSTLVSGKRSSVVSNGKKNKKHNHDFFRVRHCWDCLKYLLQWNSNTAYRRLLPIKSFSLLKILNIITNLINNKEIHMNKVFIIKNLMKTN